MCREKSPNRFIIVIIMIIIIIITIIIIIIIILLFCYFSLWFLFNRTAHSDYYGRSKMVAVNHMTSSFQVMDLKWTC